MSLLVPPGDLGIIASLIVLCVYVAIFTWLLHIIIQGAGGVRNLWKRICDFKGPPLRETPAQDMTSVPTKDLCPIRYVIILNTADLTEDKIYQIKKRISSKN